MFRTMIVGASCFLALASYTLAEPPSPSLARQVPNFELKDVAGKSVSLSDYKGRKALVVVFLGTECPINNAFLPRLAEVHRDYAAKGVGLLAINSNRHDTPERVAEHAAKNAIPFPVLKDVGNKVADLFGAQRTPEAFILDGERKIRYQGRIDDQFGFGYQRPQPTRRDLLEALEELLAGKPIAQATTSVSGCKIAREAPTKVEGAITFTKHVAAIVQKHCQECHRPGQIGPMSLLSYESVSSWGETIREVIADNRMPPWYADPRHGKFSNERRLSDSERATLIAWLDQGTPRGDDKDMPPRRAFTSDWTIGKPDLVLSMPEEFAVPADTPKNGIPYQNFFVDTKFTEDRWVESAEVRAGAAPVVHHIVVFILPPGKRFFPGSPTSQVLAGTAPGDMAMILRPGTAKKIPAGSQLVFQMHYTPNGTPYKDRSSIGMVFAKEAPQRRVYTVPIANLRIFIPPGADNHEIESWFTFKDDGQIIGFMPHMHLRGKDFLYEALFPDGKKEVLLSVPRYSFHWQSVYRLEKPRPVPKGTRIRCVAHFDNSARNPNNPDPTKPVFWGDQTWEEMMIGWMDYVYDRQAE